MTSRPGPDASATHRPLGDPGDGAAEGAVPVLVLLSADWAGPSRPAPTLLRELARRWGPAMHTLLVEDPDDEILDRWGVTHLPAWLRFVPDLPRANSANETTPTPTSLGDGTHQDAQTEDDRLGAGDEPVEDDRRHGLREDVLRGRSPGGADLTVPGPWVLSHRRSGALPKHAVETELGPAAD